MGVVKGKRESGRQAVVGCFSSNADFFSAGYIVYMLKRTLAVLAVVVVSLAACPANYQIANLQAGSTLLRQVQSPSPPTTQTPSPPKATHTCSPKPSTKRPASPSPSRTSNSTSSQPITSQSTLPISTAFEPFSNGTTPHHSGSVCVSTSGPALTLKCSSATSASTISHPEMEEPSPIPI